MHVRKQYQRGDMIVGGGCPVERGPFIRRDVIQKGDFLIGGPRMLTKSGGPVRYGESLDEIRKRMDALAVKIRQTAEAVRRAERA